MFAGCLVGMYLNSNYNISVGTVLHVFNVESQFI